MGGRGCCRQVSFRREPEETEFLPTQEFLEGLTCSAALGSCALGDGCSPGAAGRSSSANGSWHAWCPALGGCPAPPQPRHRVRPSPKAPSSSLAEMNGSLRSQEGR